MTVLLLAAWVWAILQLGKLYWSIPPVHGKMIESEYSILVCGKLALVMRRIEFCTVGSFQYQAGHPVMLYPLFP